VPRNIAVVSTSINAMPGAYEAWSSDDRVDLIVAGDRKTPLELREYLTDIDAVYLSPQYQSAEFTWSELLGWNKIQRRSAAIMEVLRRKQYDYVITVDDDNWPVPNVTEFINGHLRNFAAFPEQVTCLASKSPFLNTGALCSPMFHQRGVPYGVNTTPIIVRAHERTRVVVAQAQVLGDPDCDAIERMCYAPDVKAVRSNAIIRPGTYAAFNTQATMWSIEWAPLMVCLPGIGRYDDIFAAYLFHRISREHNVALFVGEPVVRQMRNEHDLIADLRQELWGMHFTFDFVGALQNAHISASMPLWHAWDELIYAAGDVLPRDTLAFAKAWVQDWKTL
jgi:hypothetical protein